jgi:hypothetical protein
MPLGLSMRLPRTIEEKIGQRSLRVGDTVASHLPDDDRQFRQNLLDLPPVEPAPMTQHRDQRNDDNFLGDGPVRSAPENNSDHPIRIVANLADRCDDISERPQPSGLENPRLRAVRGKSPEELSFEILAQSHAPTLNSATHPTTPATAHSIIDDVARRPLTPTRRRHTGTGGSGDCVGSEVAGDGHVNRWWRTSLSSASSHLLHA